MDCEIRKKAKDNKNSIYIIQAPESMTFQVYYMRITTSNEMHFSLFYFIFFLFVKTGVL